MKIGIAAAAPLADALRRATALTEHTILWSTADPAQVLERCAAQPPNLLLVDIATAHALDTIRNVIAGGTCAVMAVAADVGVDATRVFHAMGHGAIDAVDAPPLDAPNWRIAVLPFVSKLNAVAKRVARQQRREGPVGKPIGALDKLPLVAIGASAGGPAALATLLGGLPPHFSAAIVIVQHVDQQFAPDMAEWLSQFSQLPVRIAQEGDRPVAGVALLASTNDHLVLKTADRLGYSVHPRAQVYRPSVDAFFHSAEAHWPGEIVGVVLTGMGRDGAQGLKALRSKGCYTIAQDKATSAVYGMPHAAAGAAVDVLPLDAIAARLTQHFSQAIPAGA